MRIKDVTAVLEAWAPPSLQEDYDNSGLQLGDPAAEITAAMVCLDVNEAVVEEAASTGCGLIISHHPLIFKGLRSLTGRTAVERTLLAAIRHNIALYAIHTNLDNVIDGVNGEIAQRMGLKPLHVLDPKQGQLRKLVVFVPLDHAEQVRNAVFQAGGGAIGLYDECSFTLEGTGSFRPTAGADPFVGRVGERHAAREVRMEFLYAPHREQAIVSAMLQEHPYEEVAYDLYPLLNTDRHVGSGLVGELEVAVSGQEFLELLKKVFRVRALRHTVLPERPVKRVAVCGGSGAFLIPKAIRAGVDAYVTGDVKYHEFFDASNRLLLVDIGHYGSEQYTMDLIQRKLTEKFPTFAVRLTETVTDPIYHY
jgi:dinuclear metal center YbgI/SA1388 family protein